jgi:hypothetical protein
MSFLTGKPAKSESKNLAYPYIQNTFGGAASNLLNEGQSGLNQYLATLSGADNGAGYNAYKDSTGYEDIFNESQRAVTGSQAARGLLGSGSTVRALADRGGQLAQQGFGNYLQQLMAGSQAGLGAATNFGGLIANAGQTSTQTGATGGLLGALGGIASLASGIGGAAGSLKSGFGKKG